MVAQSVLNAAYSIVVQNRIAARRKRMLKKIKQAGIKLSFAEHLYTNSDLKRIYNILTQ